MATAWLLILLVLSAAAPGRLDAQRRFRGGGGSGADYRGTEPPTANIPYDGRFTFARIRYETAPGGWYYRGLPAWAHGYHEAELNLMKILNEMSLLAIGVKTYVSTVVGPLAVLVCILAGSSVRGRTSTARASRRRLLRRAGGRVGRLRRDGRSAGCNRGRSEPARHWPVPA